MDSMMIESNIRFLSRMELIYTCISKLTIYFDKNYPNKIPDDLRHYTDSNDYNRIFYHQLNDIEGIRQDHHSYKGFEHPLKKHPCVNFMEVVAFYEHLLFVI